ncbi:porin [Herbaspirillum sp. ST 5-3]|uniref:porin n=1 Tax=Oxalobacteraceae TaxID=75682 RepID=UPI001455DBEF|nr:porin [Herbaspirillum sp. ST 5-3]
MKKSLLALAVLGAFAGAAQAQSAVTIYGSFDAGVRNLTNVNAAGDNRLTMGSNGQYNSNRIGFKGVEDLGGGLNAHFVLETGFNTGTGALDNATNRLFNRSAYVGLGGAWGSVDLGRQYSVNFKTIGLYDPFNYKYTAIVPLAAQGGLTRLDNDIQYTGAFGPVSVRAEYALGEQAGSTSNGASQAIGASYAGGPVTVGGAYTKRKNAVGTAFMDFDNWTVGAAYATGPFRVATGYAKATQDTSATTETEVKDIWLGGSYNVTPAAQLSLAYYRTTTDTATTTGRRNLVILGGTYALSKRTNFYADIDNSKLSGTAVTVGQTRQTGLSVGINHLF